jgi:hypothetical protein
MSLGLAQHSLLCFLIILPFGNPTVEGQLGNMALWLLARLNLGRITQSMGGVWKDGEPSSNCPAVGEQTSH